MYVKNRTNNISIFYFAQQCNVCKTALVIRSSRKLLWYFVEHYDCLHWRLSNVYSKPQKGSQRGIGNKAGLRRLFINDQFDENNDMYVTIVSDLLIILTDQLNSMHKVGVSQIDVPGSMLPGRLR